jgi:hypothetical protein
MKKNAMMMSKKDPKAKNKRIMMNMNRKRGGISGTFAYY